MRRDEQLVDDVLSDADFASPMPSLQKVDRHYSSLNDFNLATSQLPYMKMVSLTDKELMKVQSSAYLPHLVSKDDEPGYARQKTTGDEMQTGGISLKPIFVDEDKFIRERPEI